MALLLVLLLSIESFAAVVSDNDGSAFITKAEFDSLKNNFQNQIDQYNTSIDSKIDGAIASYLAGIKTTATEPSKVLVDNYSNMMWVRNYDVYGKWKKWTSNTGMTQNMTDSWFEPSLNEKRYTFRNHDFVFYSPVRFSSGYTTTYFAFTPTSASNGAAEAVTTGWPNGNFTGIPTLVVRLRKDANDNWTVRQTFNIYTMNSNAFAIDHVASNWSGTDAWSWGNKRWIVSAIEILDKGAKDILRFKISAYRPGNPSAVSSMIDTWYPDIMPFPGAWAFDGMNAGVGNDKFTTQTEAYRTSTGAWSISNFFGTGCTWHNLADKSVQDAFLRNMMFGQSNSQQVNTAYYKEKYWGEFGEYDYSKSTSSATLTGRIWEATLMGYVHSLASDNLTSATDTVNVPCTISVPHWPTEYLRDLTSGLFVYNNNGLKYGEGMPLRVDNQTNGYLQISFDSEVVGIRLGGKHTSQDLKIDMRKENFLSDTVNWVQGYKGHVNPDSTSEELITLRNYQYNTTDGKVKLTIPMKKDESLWIRIAPWTSDKGYCAKWSNLNMTINTN